MARPINVYLPTEDRQALAELALREDRDVERQAERLIREGLIGTGLFPSLERKTAAGPTPASAGAAR